MSRIDRVTEAVTSHSKVVVAAMVLLTVLVGSGAGMVDQSSSLDQFQSESEAAEKLSYINANFTSGPENQTSVQVIVRGDDVLSRDALVATLELQQAVRNDEAIAPTLVENGSTVGVANLVASAAIRAEPARELQRTAGEFERLNRTVAEERAAIERRNATLTETSTLLRAALTDLREDRSRSVDAEFERVGANTSVDLNQSDFQTFEQAASQLRSADDQSEVQGAYRTGTRGVLAEEYQQLQQRNQSLQRQAQRLQELGQQLQEQRTALEAASSPTLQEQIDRVESMNDSELERTLESVLNASSPGSERALAFMPTSYEPGDETANATMLLVTQRTSGGSSGGGFASEAVMDAQLAMQDVADERLSASGLEAFVFGAGLITEEIDDSMSDSLLIVGPLALLFVLLALAVAYRDALDILLGLAGIGVVLVWTFGFMGWAGISFNQIFVAVPVLLIGLSIDYAIHIFMRHREERQELGNGVRGSMRVALASVGIALVWVTATTVIGFLSNLTSPVPPIQDFGVVSAVGISAALLVFGVLVPALKVELDEFLESRGWDRNERAFGTGGGRISRALAVGSRAAQTAPWAVIALALVLSAGGAYGATQVDTTFDQEDFIAEDPPEWTKELPEPFAPGDYSAKEHLEYVNRNFVREDAQAQLLLQGDATDPGALAAVANASDAAAESPVSKELAGGGAQIQSPLSVMDDVAAQNESFNATLAAADANGDGVPERNVREVYDALYAAAPDQARSVVHRTEAGEYRALRIVVTTSGTASNADVTSEMQAIADDVEAATGLETTATGQAITFNIVQEQLLQTVIESLLVTLVAVFAFLMLTYRITEGSATLGAFTLLPVVLSVSWILGTMYLLGIPFNVMTGMITSLTVGLGVAYSIHLSERYNHELDRTDSVWTAMNRAVTGTGGALLGSAATTVGGFGVLAFAILPPLQQFGIITGLTIVYAFLAAVLVLPSLLIVWTKYFGPAVDTSAPVQGTLSADVAGGEDD